MTNSWTDFEEKARRVMEEKFGVRLSPSSININGKYKIFDLVNLEKRIVGDVKHYKTTRGGNRPSAKFSILNEYVWLMQLVEKYNEGNWRKLFVVGEDLEMLKKYVNEFDMWLSNIEVYFYKENSKLIKIR